MLVQYVRNYQNQKIGVVVATSRDTIGWSQCSYKDEFNKKRGLDIALGRLLKGTNSKPVPIKVNVWDTGGSHVVKVDIVSDTIEEMRDRARRYYKEQL